ncbi:MAG: TonB-dependent receptor [Tannerella sp.]|jgi:TonB-linked SusC/RagA family outer membrane protein|nr:TonB-dependent receptor [Tannerella sp.]
MKNNLYGIYIRCLIVFLLSFPGSRICYADPIIAQSGTKNIKGVIIDTNGDPLPGATIQIKGTTKGVITDADGKFSDLTATNSDILVVMYIGMTTKEIPVTDKTDFTIVLEEASIALEEVQVVAFGRQKKESVISSITSVRPSDLKVPSSNLTTAMAGRIAGIIAYQRSGEPGVDNADFFIRGVTTFGYKKDPLLLLDNNEISSSELARIQPDDIASFNIMKDAAATALYGSRGANGVILVTTKEGVEGKARLNIRIEESISTPTRNIELADPITYMRLHNEAVRTRDPLGITLYSQNKIDNTIRGGNPYVYPANDWYDLMFNDIAQSQRVNFNLNGGGKVARYYIAGTYNNDNGNLKVNRMNNFNSNINVQRFMLRTNVNINVTPTTEVKVRLQGKFDDYHGPIDGGEAIYRKVMRTNPVLFPPYYLPDEANIHTRHILFGNYDKAQYTNPYADMTKGYKESSDSQMFAQFELEQNLEFLLKGLSFRGMFNTSRYSYFDVQRFYNPFYYNVAYYDKTNDVYRLTLLNEQSGREYLGYNEGQKKVESTMYGESALNWNQTYNEDHNVGGMLVFTVRNYQASNAGDLQRSLPSRNVNLAGRFTYAFASKYFTEFNFGYNGSERFARKERFGFFPSGGAGWIISNEAFYGEGLKRILPKFKLKGTYGLVGNDAIGSEADRFFYLSNVNMENGDRGSSFGTYGNSSGGYYLSGISISRYANDLITWEVSRKLNVGFEANLYDQLEIVADYFTEHRSNILMARQSIPATMGLQSAISANIGEAASHGVDISFDYTHYVKKDFWLKGMANFTYATSEFLVYEEPDYSETPWKSRVGTSLNQATGYVAERLFVDEEEIRNSPIQFGTYMAGDIKYKDINNDGKITELDQVPIGYPTSPEIVYGVILSTGYKNFDISCFFQGLARESFWIDLSDDLANGRIGTAPFINREGALLKAYADDHWSEDNRNVYALYPRLAETHIQNNEQRSTWFMQNGAFLRLKSLEFGYTVPARLSKKVLIDNFRVYFSGTNLMTFSRFKLWDPEMGGNGLGYPVQKVYNLGLQISF